MWFLIFLKLNLNFFLRCLPLKLKRESNLDLFQLHQLLQGTWRRNQPPSRSLRDALQETATGSFSDEKLSISFLLEYFGLTWILISVIVNTPVKLSSSLSCYLLFLFDSLPRPYLLIFGHYAWVNWGVLGQHLINCQK